MGNHQAMNILSNFDSRKTEYREMIGSSVQDFGSFYQKFGTTTPVQCALVQRSSGRNLGGLDFSMIFSCLFKNLPNHGEFVSLQFVFFRWHFFTHDYILLIWQFCQNLCYFLYWFHGQCSTNSVKEIFPLPMNTRWPMNC